VLVAYFEYYGNDYEADMTVMAADPDTCRWWSIMEPMQSAWYGAKPGEKWSSATEVFHYDGPSKKADSQS
jgi:L-rhamnose mutarotase